MTAAELQACFDLQHRASRAQPDVPLQLRRERLLRLRRLLDEHGPVLAAAVQADFGIRSPRLTEMADFLLLPALLSHTLPTPPPLGAGGEESRQNRGAHRCICSPPAPGCSASPWGWWA